MNRFMVEDLFGIEGFNIAWYIPVLGLVENFLLFK